MKRPFLAAAIWTSLAIPSVVHSDDTTDAVHLARAFVGYCIQNPGRNDQVQAAAIAFDFSPLEGEFKTMLGPEDPDAEYEGWLVSDEGFSPYLLGISEGRVNGLLISNCTVANPNIPMDEVLEELQNLVSFGPSLDDFQNSGQHYRVWSTESVADGSWISVLDAPEMGVIGGTISFSTKTVE